MRAKVSQSRFQLSVRISCRALGLGRSVFYYKPDLTRDEPVIRKIAELVERYPRYGFSKLYHVMRREGHGWNHKRFHRVYCKLGLNFRRKGKQRLPTRNPKPLSVPNELNQSWSVDFMSDSLTDGRRFRTLNIVDDFNREALALEIDLNLPSARVIRTLDRIAQWRGYPKQLRMDNGPEFVSVAMSEWSEKHNIHLEFIEPGKPMQNSFIERFNRTFREEVLNFYIFSSLSEVKEITESVLIQYNTEGRTNHLTTLPLRSS
jgi:putative transposase